VEKNPGSNCHNRFFRAPGGAGAMECRGVVNARGRERPWELVNWSAMTIMDHVKPLCPFNYSDQTPQQISFIYYIHLLLY